MQKNIIDIRLICYFFCINFLPIILSRICRFLLLFPYFCTITKRHNTKQTELNLTLKLVFQIFSCIRRNHQQATHLQRFTHVNHIGIERLTNSKSTRVMTIKTKNQSSYKCTKYSLNLRIVSLPFLD